VALGQPSRFRGTDQMSRDQFDQLMLYVFLVSGIYNTPLTSSRNIQSSIYNTLNQSNPVFHKGVRLTYNDGGTWRASNFAILVIFHCCWFWGGGVLYQTMMTEHVTSNRYLTSVTILPVFSAIYLKCKET